MSNRVFKKVIKDKQKGENYLKLIRRSLIAYLLSTFSNLFLLVVGGALIYLGWIWIIYGDLKIHIIELIILLIYEIIVLGLWFYFWYNTYLLVTTHRIEKHQPTYLLGDYKEVLWFHEINKISYAYPHFLAKLLKFGRIEIMAGESEKNNIIFDDAPNPDKLVYELREFKRKSL